MAMYSASKAAKAKTVTVLATPRRPYFDGIGKDIKAATSLETALKMSGLDFTISKRPVQFITERLDIKTGNIEKVAKVIPDTFATVRDDTKTALGVVGKNYTILQNNTAFDFLDSLTADTKFEAAGTYDEKGARSFIVIKTENMEIMGDTFLPYILLTNAHDGSGSVRACFTPLNSKTHAPLVRTIKGVSNRVSIKHTNSMQRRLDAAKLVLLNNTKYLEAIKEEAERQNLMPYTSSQFKDLVMRLFATPADASDIQKLRNNALLEELINAYDQTDLARFGQTVYHATQAVANFEMFLPAFRTTKTMQFRNINTVINGMPLLNQVTNELMGIK